MKCHYYVQSFLEGVRDFHQPELHTHELLQSLVWAERSLIPVSFTHRELSVAPIDVRRGVHTRFFKAIYAFFDAREWIRVVLISIVIPEHTDTESEWSIYFGSEHHRGCLLRVICGYYASVVNYIDIFPRELVLFSDFPARVLSYWRVVSFKVIFVTFVLYYIHPPVQHTCVSLQHRVYFPVPCLSISSSGMSPTAVDDLIFMRMAVSCYSASGVFCFWHWWDTEIVEYKLFASRMLGSFPKDKVSTSKTDTSFSEK